MLTTLMPAPSQLQLRIATITAMSRGWTLRRILSLTTKWFTLILASM